MPFPIRRALFTLGSVIATACAVEPPPANQRPAAPNVFQLEPAPDPAAASVPGPTRTAEPATPGPTTGTLPGPGATEGPAPAPGQASSAPSTAPTTSVPSAGPIAGGSGGSGGSGQAPPEPAVGRVWGGLAGDVPLAGATILLTNGRTFETDADGRFVLDRTLPDDRTFVVHHPTHVTSVVSDLEGAPEFHLAPRAFPPADLPETVAFTVTGRVVDATGAPRAGIVLVLDDASGAFSSPAATAADGSYSMRVFAPGGRVSNGTLLATGTAEDAWVGAATGIDVAQATPVVDAVPGTATPDPLVVVEARHRVTVSIDTRDLPGLLDANVYMVGPDGVSFSLPGPLDDKRVAALPGIRYELRAEIFDAEAGTRSALQRALTRLDFAAPASVFNERLLQPPTVQAPPAWEADALVTWEGISEARGYRATLAGLDEQGFLWEGFTPARSLRLTLAAPLAPGRYAFTVAAWDEEGLSPRTVASLPDGPRALRVLPLSGTWRMASRQLRFTI